MGCAASTDRTPSKEFARGDNLSDIGLSTKAHDVSSSSESTARQRAVVLENRLKFEELRYRERLVEAKLMQLQEHNELPFFVPLQPKHLRR